MLEGSRVFVTGGAGVIGSELVPMLLSRGAKVLVGDLKPKPRYFSEKVQYRRGDLNQLSLDELVAFSPNIIFHLAATFERSTETLGFWSENHLHNVHLSHHLMTLAQGLTSLNRVVFASSYLVYDPALYLFEKPPGQPTELNEETEIRPRNLTGMAKLAHETELGFLSGFNECSFSQVSARKFRGYGRDSRDVISRWVRSLVNQEEIQVFGVESMFDYVYSKDSARGLLEIASIPELGGPINLGTGKARRVSDVLEVLSEHFPQANIRHESSDVLFEASQADTSRLKDYLPWSPEYELEQGISEIIRHELSKNA